MNTAQHVCNYAVLRYLPHPETGEFVNVGVVGQIRSVPTLIPAFSLRGFAAHGEKEKREAIRRLNPAIPEEARELSCAEILTT